MRNNITIEMIDAVITRLPDVRYEHAKEALIVTNGDVVDAIIFLESNMTTPKKANKVKKAVEDVLPRDSEDLKELKEQVKELLKKSSVIRVLVEKNDKTIINIPLTVGVVGIALGPVVTLVGLSAALIGKYQIKIQNEDDGNTVNLGDLNEEKINMLKNMLANTAKEVKDVVVDHKKDDKDITDELISEDDILD